MDPLKRFLLSEMKNTKTEKLLYITANPKPLEDSYSLSVGQEFLQTYQKQNPEDRIIILDLYQTQLPLIDSDILAGWEKEEKGTSFSLIPQKERNKTRTIENLAEQFHQADKYIFVNPIWNFNLPSLMKGYLDAVAGKPFGLVSREDKKEQKKKALHIQACGKAYPEMDFGSLYLKTFLSCLGIDSFLSIIIEKTASLEAQANKEQAILKAKKLAEEF